MSSPAIEAVRARFASLRPLFGMAPPGAFGPRETVEEIAAQPARAAVPLDRCTAAVTLAALARLPTEAELARVRAKRDGGLAELTDDLLRSREMEDLIASGIDYDLRFPAPGELWIDVTSTASAAHLSGIQRVVRSLCATLLEQKRPVVFFDLSGERPRVLDSGEAARALDPAATRANRRRGFAGRFFRALLVGWYQAAMGFLRGFSGTFGSDGSWARGLEAMKTRLARAWHRRGAAARKGTRVVVAAPFGASILLPEMPLDDAHAERIGRMTRALSTHLALLVYDMIPLLQPEFSQADTRALFARYLTLLRDAERASCISRSVAIHVDRFCFLVDRGERPMLEFRVHTLPSEPFLAPAAAATSRPVHQSSMNDISSMNDRSPPLILCVGSIEPRKNGVAVIRAAARIAASGVRFRLVFAGAKGMMNEPFWDTVAAARAGGLLVEVRLEVSDAELRALYEACRFSVFCSLAEGFGLPIVESLSHGRPVLVSDRGSMAEIASDGGCLSVDPASDVSIEAGMRKLLGDDALLAKLTEEARKRPVRGWREYADELFAFSLRPPPT